MIPRGAGGAGGAGGARWTSQPVRVAEPRGASGVRDAVQAAVDRVGRATAAAVLSTALEVLVSAREQWPVKSGRSSAAFEVELEQRGLSVVASLSNGVDYVDEINDGETLRELVVEPINEAAPRVSAAIVREVGR